jgi:hypothetical protein
MLSHGLRALAPLCVFLHYLLTVQWSGDAAAAAYDAALQTAAVAAVAASFLVAVVAARTPLLSWIVATTGGCVAALAGAFVCGASLRRCAHVDTRLFAALLSATAVAPLLLLPLSSDRSAGSVVAALLNTTPLSSSSSSSSSLSSLPSSSSSSSSLSSSDWRHYTLVTSTATLCGAVAGSFYLPFDWGLAWQCWPTPCARAAAVAHVASAVTAAAWIRLSRLWQTKTTKRH